MRKIMVSVLGAAILSAAILTGCSAIRKGEGDKTKAETVQEQPEKNSQEGSKEDMGTVADGEEKHEEGREEEQDREEKREEKQDQEEEPAIRLSGLSEEALSVMGCTQKELAEALKEWTEENGYSSAAGAEFYDPMWIRFGEGRYSMDCRLAIGSEGNGVSENAGSIVLTLDVFKGKKQIRFHQ